MPSPSHLALFPSESTRSRSPRRSASPPPLADPSLLDGKITDLNARIQTLESERGSLLEQIEELKHRLQSAPLSKEKEFLSLRETINRKEKDILDLRDALDAKDRQMLDQKDRVREHERARRDLEERTLDFEKSLMAAQERVGRPGPRQGKGHRAGKGAEGPPGRRPHRDREDPRRGRQPEAPAGPDRGARSGRSSTRCGWSWRRGCARPRSTTAPRWPACPTSGWRWRRT